MESMTATDWQTFRWFLAAWFLLAIVLGASCVERRKP